MTSLNPSLIMGAIEFADLPVNKEHPHHSAWLWGPDDGLGTLNYLTPSIVAAAAKEIRTGDRICLNWDLTKPKYPGFGRQPFEHKVFQKGDRTVTDDVIHYNTQHSSQWDGFRHFGYQKEKVFYNGATLPQVLGEEDGCGKGMALGMAEWAKQGIAGRGVLLDVYGYCQDHDLAYDPWSTHEIPLRVLQDCAAHQKVTFKHGDLLFVRTGYHATYETSSEVAIEAKSAVDPPCYAGVAQDMAIAEWIYNHKFSAVAGDAPAFESWPHDGPEKEIGCALHEIFLGGWGMPIGEMFYLERLVEMCRDAERWSFFVSSSPLNVPGGVATTPNVMAIF